MCQLWEGEDTPLPTRWEDSALARLVLTLTLAFVLFLAPSLRAANDFSTIPETEEVEETAAPAPASQAADHTPFEWFLVLVFLALSLCGGGYTLLCYLRRRDTLSLLATLESRRRTSSGFDDFTNS